MADGLEMKFVILSSVFTIGAHAFQTIRLKSSAADAGKYFRTQTSFIHLASLPSFALTRNLCVYVCACLSHGTFILIIRKNFANSSRYFYFLNKENDYEIFIFIKTVVSLIIDATREMT